MAKSRVSITVWKTWKGSRHYTPFLNLRRIYTLIKKAISTFYLCTGYFINEIENIFSVFPYVIETLVKVWENSK